MATRTVNSETVGQAPEARSTVLYSLAAYAETLLLAVWLGSMIFFSFAVAPGAFAIFPDQRELAGRVVTSNITKIETFGLVIGPALILIQLMTWRANSASGRARAVKAALLVLMTVAAALSRFWVSAKLASLRVSMGVIDNIPATDPRRVEFNSLHQYSVILMGAAMMAGLIVLFLTVRSWLRR
jgi:Domain of unknown function (DUF4149)